LTHIAEDHRLDVDRRSQIMGNIGRIAIVDGPLAIPGLEDCLSGHLQLLEGIFGEFNTSSFAHDDFELLSEFLPCFGWQVRIRFHAILFALARDGLFKCVIVHAQDDAAEHLHQATV